MWEWQLLICHFGNYVCDRSPLILPSKNVTTRAAEGFKLEIGKNEDIDAWDDDEK